MTRWARRRSWWSRTTSRSPAALAGALESQGYTIGRAATGRGALRSVRAEPPELVLLDLGLPDIDGVEVCRLLRELDPVLPIVILTARHDEIDVVLGLDAGADDYVTKPFRLAELLARVRAHLRQPRIEDQAILRVGDIEVDRGARRVRVGGAELDLRAKEFDLLAFLMSEAGSAVTRERIMSEVWDEHWFGSTKTLDMHVSSLRRKLAEVAGDDVGARSHHDAPRSGISLRGSVRRRILVAIIAATTVGVVVFAVPLGFALAKLYHEEEVVQLERTAAEAAERVPHSYPDSTTPIVLPKPNRPHSVSMYDATARRVAGHGPAVGDFVVREALNGDAHNRYTHTSLVFATPVIRGNGVVAALRVATPLSTVSNRTRTAVLVMLGIGVLAIGASALLATWQSRRLARPVTRLAEEAIRLGDGDFTIRSNSSGIDEVDAVSRALEQTAGRLDDLLTRERAFSADASHQLRTPLTGLRLTLETAALDPGADRDVAIFTAIDEVDRLERTIDDLLELAREVPAERPRLDLGGFLAGLDRDWDARLLGSGRELMLEIDRALPSVPISDRALRQILDVLIDNARIHGAGRITVRARRAPPGVVVEVSDEGDGINGETAQIFERRGPGSSRHGIGLALARSLADAEGARLVLEHAAPHPIFAVVMPTA